MKRGSETGDIFSPWVRRAVLTVVFVSGAAVVGTLLYGAKLVLPQAGSTDSYGGGPIGHRAFAEVMERLGMHVLQGRTDRYENGSAPLLFLEPAVEARIEGRLHRLADAVERRGEAANPTVVVLPKWDFAVGLVADGRVAGVPKGRIDEVFDAALGIDDPGLQVAQSDDMQGYYRLEGLLGEFAAEVPQLQTIAQIPVGATVLLESPFGAVVVESANGTVVVSDPDLIHSFNFHRADHAALWVAILDRFGSDTIVIDETFHGHGKVLSLKEALGQFPTVLLVVHALLLLVLLFLLGSKRFGPPEESVGYGHGPQEAIAVAASVLADGQPIGRLTYNYVVEVLQDLHRQLGLADTPTLLARAEGIDTVAQQRGVPAVAVSLLNQANGLGEGRRVHGEAWKIARAVHSFRMRLLNRNRTKASL
ncbi:MAG: hypothetical protein AAGE52_07775 [Myxococcota bacterium]